MATPILTTKLHIPSPGRSLVPRQRLIECLNRALTCKLTVISAPAGFGKTTCLSEWVGSLTVGGSPRVRVGWISLDEGDNDPARFSAYLTAALRATDEHGVQAGEDGEEWAGSWFQEAHLVQLINRVAVRPEPLLLILDDYHLITSPVIHEALTFLIDHLSDNLHLILATRADPPLPLPRLRARGHLLELRQSDLRFTLEEAAAFLNQVMALDLSAQDVAALETRTEGWIAGLQMASLAMQAQRFPPGQARQPSSRSDFIQAFTGSHRHVLDYLVQEVLERQPSAIQEFLLKTSVLERLTGPLCDAILVDWETGILGNGAESRSAGWSPDNSQSVLEQLEAANLFIIPLDQERRWYRYHRLFADLLSKRLGQSSPGLLPELHRRASFWHEQQGLMPGAIDHALAARDFERAARLLEDSVEATLMRSEVTTFLNWMDRLPDEQVRSSPTLCFFHAWTLLMSGRSMVVAEQRLEDLAAVQGHSEAAAVLAGRMAALRAYLMLFRVDLHQAVELCYQALDRLPASDLFLRSIVAWILSLARLDDGSLQDGEEALQEVAIKSQELGNPLIAVTALCHQARLQMREGRLHRARETYQQALQAATDPQGQRLPIASEALIGLGDLLREWNDLETAGGCLVEGIELAGQWSQLAAFDAYAPLALVRLAQGNAQGAREALQTAQQLALRSETTRVDDIVAELQLAYLAVMQGDLAEGVRWAEKRGLMTGTPPRPTPELDEGQDLIAAHMRKYEHLLLARLYILQERAVQALDLLAPLLEQARQLGRIDLLIQIHILRALAWQAEGQQAQAMQALTEALSLAEPGGFVRIFVDEGEPMARLLRQAASRGLAPIYVARLRTALGDPAAAAAGVAVQAAQAQPYAQPLVEPLSERELQVLRLLAAGLSNPEIAAELYLAVSTVRSHCKSIYGKLNVHKRWAAVQRGRELGLV